jgi:hypothetical protein
MINDGRMFAYSADKGEKLLELQLGRSGFGAPITYQLDGKQYIAIMGGSGRPATVIGPNDAKVDNAPLLYVFELDGKAEMPVRVGPPPGFPPPPTAAPKPVATPPPPVAPPH